MIFASFDAENISLLRNVKKIYDLLEIYLMAKEIVRPPRKAVRIRDIACTLIYERIFTAPE